MSILEKLEWLTKYGFIDIVFGVGVLSFLVNLIRKAIPSNYEHLHISISMGEAVSIPPNVTTQQSFNIYLSNAGQVNFYIARAYFRTKQRKWWSLWLWDKATQLYIHPKSDRIAHKNNALN